LKTQAIIYFFRILYRKYVNKFVSDFKLKITSIVKILINLKPKYKKTLVIIDLLQIRITDARFARASFLFFTYYIYIYIYILYFIFCNFFYTCLNVYK